MKIFPVAIVTIPWYVSIPALAVGYPGSGNPGLLQKVEAMAEDLMKLLTWLAKVLPDVSEETQQAATYWVLVLMVVHVVLTTGLQIILGHR